MSPNDVAQTNLKEPEKTDWDNYNSGGSKWAPPPPPVGSDGKPIVYYGVVESATETEADEGYLNYLLDPIKIIRSGAADGQIIRFTRASVKPFMKRDKDGVLQPMKGNPTKIGNFLRSVGLKVTPQTNADYRMAIRTAVGKAFPFVGDWEAYNKDTQETVRGYAAFPDDPERPGQKKAILRAGDVINELDSKGNIIGTRRVQSDVLFANFRLRYFRDPAPKVNG